MISAFRDLGKGKERGWGRRMNGAIRVKTAIRGKREIHPKGVIWFQTDIWVNPTTASKAHNHSVHPLQLVTTSVH